MSLGHKQKAMWSGSELHSAPEEADVDNRAMLQELALLLASTLFPAGTEEDWRVLH